MKKRETDKMMIERRRLRECIKKSGKDLKEQRNLPLVRVFRSGWRLLKLVTLLLSALRSTGGGRPEGVSLCERSCIGARLPAEPTRRGAPGEGSNPEWIPRPGTGRGVGTQCFGWYGRVLWGSERASIFRTACGEAAPNLVPVEFF